MGGDGGCFFLFLPVWLFWLCVEFISSSLACIVHATVYAYDAVFSFFSSFFLVINILRINLNSKQEIFPFILYHHVQ